LQLVTVLVPGLLVLLLVLGLEQELLVLQSG
jgi:hypothetical protein